MIATATIAAIAGGGGLGDIIVNQASYGLDGVIGAALCVSLLAFSADLLLALAQRAVTPRALARDDFRAGAGSCAASRELGLPSIVPI